MSISLIDYHAFRDYSLRARFVFSNLDVFRRKGDIELLAYITTRWSVDFGSNRAVYSFHSHPVCCLPMNRNLWYAGATESTGAVASYVLCRTADLRNDEMTQLRLPFVFTPKPAFGLILPQASTREEAARWVEVLKVLQTMEEEESKVSLRNLLSILCNSFPSSLGV